MNIPFTVEQFFDVFRTYNVAIWPAQVVAYLMGVIALALSARKTHELLARGGGQPRPIEAVV